MLNTLYNRNPSILDSLYNRNLSILDYLYIGNPSILDSLYTGLPLYRVSGYVRLSKINNDIDNNSKLARKTSKANYCDGFIILNQM